MRSARLGGLGRIVVYGAIARRPARGGALASRMAPACALKGLREKTVEESAQLGILASDVRSHATVQSRVWTSVGVMATGSARVC